MSAFVVRVRGASGTSRVNLPGSSASLSDLRAAVASAVGIPPDSQILSRAPGGSDPIPSSDSMTVADAGLSHGVLLHIEDARSAPTSGAACTHPPQFKCMRCSTAADQAGLQRCDHPDSMTCPNCMDTANTGTDLRWLCNHGPGGRCLNCAPSSGSAEAGKGKKKDKKKDKKKKKNKKKNKKKKKNKLTAQCRHGPNMVCSSCIGGGDGSSNGSNSFSDDDDDDGAGGGSRKKGKGRTLCSHPANWVCPECTSDNEPDAAAPAIVCRNHGPNGKCLECMTGFWVAPKLTRQDRAHCRRVSVAYGQGNVFQAHIQSTREQRMGVLYGTVEAGEVAVEAIYEPPQVCDASGFELLDDPDWELADQIASYLGLRQVGWIYSHASDSPAPTGAEVLQIAPRQAGADTSRFVTLVASQATDGTVRLEAYQVSDQGLDLFRSGNMLAPESPDMVNVAKPVVVEGKEVQEFAVEFLLTTVPITSHQGWLGVDFPIPSRNPVTDLHFKSYMAAGGDWLQLVSDFYLLMYLAKHGLDPVTDMPAFCGGVRAKSMADLEGFKFIVDAMAALH